MLLLNASKTLTPADSKTNIAIPFLVPAGCEKLWISYSYAPKELNDLQTAKEIIERGLAHYAPAPFRDGYGNWADYLPLVSLITLSLDSPEGYCGCAHRHDPAVQLTISPLKAGPGFCPPARMAGKWRAVLNCHAVVTSTCKATLLIADCEEDFPKTD